MPKGIRSSDPAIEESSDDMEEMEFDYTPNP